MEKEILFSMQSPFRDTFRIRGFRFGKGEHTLAIVGAMRGDEIQQQYICSQLVRKLEELESKNKLVPGHEILVIPSVNPFSMNIGKRFWAMDNTDINRMFPGYDKGETTQRIAAAVFKAIQGYEYGIQMASFYMPGDFIPHVRMVQTGYEDIDSAKLFGLPYVCVRKPLPFDTTLLNYNWQIWNTKAFSFYAGENNRVENITAVSTVLRFMDRIGVIQYKSTSSPDYNSQVLDEDSLCTVKSPTGGIFYRLKMPSDVVEKGEVLAHILDPYEGTIKAEVTSPVDGIVFFCHNKPLALERTPLFKILEQS